MAFTRKPGTNDFELTVPDVGSWTFGRRTLADGMAIRREAYRLAGEALQHDTDLRQWSWMVATLTVLTAQPAKGYEDLDSLPWDAQDDKVDKLWVVYGALLEKEKSFRAPPKNGGEAPGQAAR